MIQISEKKTLFEKRQNYLRQKSLSLQRSHCDGPEIPEKKRLKKTKKKKKRNWTKGTVVVTGRKRKRKRRNHRNERIRERRNNAIFGTERKRGVVQR